MASLHIIEDDEDSANLLSRFLTRSGFEVGTSVTGEEGVEVVLEEQPDLVILDIMLPGKSGLEVMDELRNDPRGKDIPILFLTSVGDEATIVEGLRGGDDYLVKPVKLLELEARVQKILERRAKGEAVPYRTKATQERLAVEVDKETILIPYKEILFAEASGKYCYVYTPSRRFLTDYSIGALEKRPNVSSQFQRVHRSYLVNLDYVRKVVKEKPRKIVVAAGGAVKELPIGDSYYSDVKSRLDI